MSIEKEYHDLDRRELTILGRWFWGTVVAVVATFFWAVGAYAEEVPVHVIEQNGIVIKLMSTPCVDPKSLAQINPQMAPKFKASDSMWPEKDGTKKRYAGCWLEVKAGEYGMPEDVFVFVFEDNTSGVVPKAEALKKTGLTGV